MESLPTKPEALESTVGDHPTNSPTPRRRGRPRTSSSVSVSAAKRRRDSSVVKSHRGGNRGGGKSSGRGRGRGTARTKAAKSAVGENDEAAEDFTVLAASALDYAEDSSAPEDDDDVDDAGSDYVPEGGEADHNDGDDDDDDEEEELYDPEEDEEYGGSSSRKRRRTKKSGGLATNQEDDEFDISDYEDDDDGMQESRVHLMNEVCAMQGSGKRDKPMSLFSDIAAAAVAAAAANTSGDGAEKDIYDFDAQSIASDKRFKKMRQAAAARQARKSAGVGSSSARGRPVRPATHVGASWGSNIYSALATSLKTRADLDVYTNFLKCPYLNNFLDSMFVDMCRPSNQHMGLFFGPSASLQSLMGRVNDPDRVVELLHAFMSKSYDALANRIVWFAPIIHQQPVPLSNMSSFDDRLSALSESLDPEMRIEPAYILEGNLNVLVQTGAPFTDLEVSLIQHTAINSAGHMGRFMTDVHQIVLSNDFWDQLNDLVALPYEKIISYAERSTTATDGDASVNLEAIEPPCLHRIIAAVNSENKLLGIASTDTWDRTNVPLSRKRRTLTFENLQRGSLQLSEVDRSSLVNDELPIELDTYGVLEHVIDDVAKMRAHEEESAESSSRTSPEIGRIHLMDCFLLKPNSRKDALILVCYESSASPPMPNPSPVGCSPFKVYSLVSEENFFFSRFGITSDSPALMDGMFTADPEAIVERKSVVIVPDLVFNSLRSIALREVVASSGTAIVNAVLTNINTTVEAPSLYRCSKFILVDSQRRVPLAIVFEVPIRLSWTTDATECAVHSLDTASLNAKFGSVTVESLKAAERKFSSKITECRLVVINGLLYALQVDENRVLQRIVELLPAGYGNVTGHPDHISLAPQAVTGDARACSAFLRIFNEESSTSSVFPAVYLPHFGQQTLVDQVTSFCDELVDHIYTSPLSFSLYDVVFRMALKHTPKMLARQHHEAAEAAAAASAAANPDDPPPPPVPMPEHWGVCSICSKELHSVSGLLEHELRHIGLTKFRCPEHGRCFMDRRALVTHMQEHAGGVIKPDDDDDGGFNETMVGEEEIKFIPGLTNVFAKSSLLSGRMESPQCDNCHDFFPTADVMAQHLEICDGISFSNRSPIEQTSDSVPVTVMKDGEKSVCGICGQAVDEIKQHFTDVHLTCVLCRAQLHTIEELSYHYKVHVESSGTTHPETSSKLNEVSTCETCLNFYSSKHNYYFHQWAEHGVIFKQNPSTGALGPVQVREPRNKQVDDEALTKLKCKFCQFVCPCPGKQYVDHLQSAHDIITDVALVCRFCAAIFPNPENLSNHLQSSHAPLSDYNNAGPQTVYRCDMCADTPFYSFHKGMLDHAREVHNTLTPNMYECPHCRERFSDRRIYRQHLEKHAEGVLHPCTECGKEFRSKQALMHHIQMRHDSEWDQGPATCEHCGITYPKRSALKYHIARMHNLELLHECPVCQQRFRIETYLRRHMKETHSGPIKCEICQKQCANLRCYSQHRQKHFRDKIFQCTECSVSFKSKTAMRRHVRVEHMQLGPEKFECQICGKIVTQIGMHMLTHKDARFKCIYCDKQFTKSVYYNEHVRIHLGQLPFECHICGRRFNKKSNLNVHLKFHEKHRDEDGNYLQLKARGRVSIMFGDANLTPEERAAKNAALKNRSNKPTQSVAVGPDLPGAFNVGGPAGSASDACAKACGGHLADVVGLRPLTSQPVALSLRGC
ncbi:unnamed protein product [Mesocestoides corti]|uniref:C2H2-type domain-containing protein n=1 Tax=Mesocestoides corti TaxID=53468 RepID=A0A0R3U2M0_MESCO|nr:unnamed protein product [Mesocestoides corti]